MGFLDELVSNTVGGGSSGGGITQLPVVSTINDTVNSLIPGSKEMQQMTGLLPGAPGPAPEDPAVTAARNRQAELVGQQQNQLEKFDLEKKGMMDRAISGGDRATRQALENRMRGIKNDASKRGLLYSGVTDAAKSNARVGAAQQFAGNREAINKSFMSAREKMQNLLDRLRFNQMEEAVIQADSVYDQALIDAEKDRGAMGNLMGAFGTAGGMAAGAQSSQQQQQAQASTPSYNQSSNYSGLDTSGYNNYSGESDRRNYA